VKKFRHFPNNCVGCQNATPTGMCGILFDLDKFLKSKYRWRTPFDITYSKRRKDCPLTDAELKEGASEAI